MNKDFKILSLFLLVFLCFAGTALGQETTGRIEGTVKDQQGAVVPNVTIIVKGIDVGFNRSLTTDGEGFYRAQQIPPGIYNVEAAPTSGFAGQSKTNIQVVLGQISNVSFDLSISSETVVDVLASSDSITVDTTDSKVQENITAREIDNLPKGTTFTSLLRTTAAARPEPLSGQFQINGGSGSENTFIIDGQEVTNFRTGVINSNNDLPYQLIQEVQVKSSGYEAEFGGATGGVVNATTKSGTNDFRGEFGIQFQPSTLQAAPRPILFRGLVGSTQVVNFQNPKRDTFNNIFPTGSLGGKIIKDRLFFFANYTPQIYNVTRNSEFFGFSSTGVLTPRLTEQFRLRQRNEYGFVKIDGNVTNSLRLSSSFTYNPITVLGGAGGLLVNGGGGAVGGAGGAIPFTQRVLTNAGVILPSANFGGAVGTLRGAQLSDVQGGRQNANNVRFEANYTPNSKSSITGRYSRGFLNEKLSSYFIPQIPRYLCVQVDNPAVAGCDQNFQNVNNNNFTNRDVSVRQIVNADATYLISNFGGRHDFKGGYEFNRITNDVDRGYAANGITQLFYGVGIQDLLGDPSIPQSSNQIGSGLLQRVQTFGVASNRNDAFYIQDKYQPFSRLTFNLGIRTEQENLPAFNGQTTNLKFSFKDKIAPRIGVAFDLTGDGKTRLSAFYGRFFDRLKFELPRGSFGGDFFTQDYFEILPDAPRFDQQTVARVTGTFGNPIGGGCPLPISAGYTTRCQFDFRVPSNIPNLVLSSGAPLQPGAVDPDLKPFRQSEFTVEFQRQLLKDSVFRARYLFRNVDDAVEDAGFQTATGSEFYIIANPGEGLHAQRGRELGFVKLATPQRRYDALQLEYDSRFLRNFSFNVNYTYSRLFGNYSGLANSDEGGRTSPGVNRLFDQPFVGFTLSGQPDNGRLATDRPHVFKASGTYSVNYGNSSNATDISFFTNVLSGTPQTTFAEAFNVIFIAYKRGDLGRTSAFTQTDFNITHRYKFGRDNRYTFAVDLNVLNAFNENNVLTVFNQLYDPAGTRIFRTSTLGPNVTYVDAVNRLLTTGLVNEYNAFVNSPADTLRRDNRYGQPNSFQEQRAIRFGFRFVF